MQRAWTSPFSPGWGLALPLAGLSLVETLAAAENQIQGPRWVVGLVSAAAVLLLAWRIDHPLAVLVTLAAALAVPMWVWGASQLSIPALALAVAVFACGRHASPRSAWVALPVGMATVLLQIDLDPSTSLADSWTWALNIFWIFGLGVWFRQKEALVRATNEQAEERVRRAAVEERLAVARDLHDLLAHNLSVMVVQAEAASALSVDDPTRAGRAMQIVSDTGRSALGEIRRLLPALREDVTSDEQRGPVSLVADLQTVAARLQEAGVAVHLNVDAESDTLRPETVRCAELLVQEALTNVLRHSSADAAAVTVVCTGSELEVTVDDSGPPSDNGTKGTGHGLLGMRERVEAMGGSLEVGPNGSGYRVRAQLPATGLAR